jgi:hypothetical protein
MGRNQANAIFNSNDWQYYDADGYIMQGITGAMMPNGWAISTTTTNTSRPPATPLPLNT